MSNDKLDKKPVVWIQCGVHAREWISISSCMYILDRLTSENEVKEALLPRFDFYIMPVVNPDGYAYTWNGTVIYFRFLVFYYVKKF